MKKVMTRVLALFQQLQRHFGMDRHLVVVRNPNRQSHLLPLHANDNTSPAKQRQFTIQKYPIASMSLITKIHTSSPVIRACSLGPS